MKGDFSRRTFDEKKHYRRVLMQQGRVQLDSDWNEQIDINLHYFRSLARDLIGKHGAPSDNAGFEIITKQGDYVIGAGHYYVDGILCENEIDVKASCQPFLPLDKNGISPARPSESGTYLVYLDVWERHITGLDDPEILEPALGGVGTTTRAKIIWQVKVKKVRPKAVQRAMDCIEIFEDPSNCSLRARASSPEGYTGLENTLYRVEIHEGGEAGSSDSPTIKWSRNNGIAVAKIEDILKNEITFLESKIQKSLFVVGDWIEVTDDRHELWGIPGTFARIVEVEGNVIKFSFSSVHGESITKCNFPDGFNPKVRRWDGEENPVIMETPYDEGDWIELDNGIEIQFSKGHYLTGDYWLIPVRPLGILWKSVEGVPKYKLPDGIEHHYCPLALVRYHKGEFTLLSDCRRLFPALIDLDIPEHENEQAREVKIEFILGNGENIPHQKFKIPKFRSSDISRIDLLVNEPRQIKEIDHIELLKERDVKEVTYHKGKIREAWVLWRPVISFGGLGPNDRVYICGMDDDGNVVIQFGDGEKGARLPAGVDNVKVIYRTGVGACDGFVDEESLMFYLHKMKCAKLFLYEERERKHAS